MNSFLVNVYPPNQFLFPFESKRISLNSFGLIKKNEGGLQDFLKQYNPRSFETKLSFHGDVHKKGDQPRDEQLPRESPKPLDIYALATQNIPHK